MSTANEFEQQMLNLINKERSNANLEPLTFNGDLNEASEDHSTWMLDTDTFSHTGKEGSSAGDRIVDAGYKLEGNWTWGENIGWQSERGEPGIADDVRDIHQSLMNSPGHRANILNPDFDEIGIGVERGDFDRFDSVMITQNFGATDAAPTPQPDDEKPDDRETPVAEKPDDKETPVAEKPDDEKPDDKETPVAEKPDDEKPDDKETPVAEKPDDENPDDKETPVAEKPDDEKPDDKETPVAEKPDHEKFDVEKFLADLNDMLEDLFDNLEFVNFDDADNDPVDMAIDMPGHGNEMPAQNEMPIECAGWDPDQFDFNVSDDPSFNFDLA